MLLLWLGIAAAAGVLMAVQGSINGSLGRIIGTWEGSFMVHAVGLLLIAALVFIFGVGQGGLAKIKEVPWYLYLGGIINVIIILGVMLSIGQIGAAKATTAIICGQLAMALIVESFGLFDLQQASFTWTKGLGLLLMGIAAKLLL